MSIPRLLQTIKHVLSASQPQQTKLRSRSAISNSESLEERVLLFANAAPTLTIGDGIEFESEYRFAGGDPDDELGTSVDFIGDIDGDFYGDYIVGVPNRNSQSGEVRIFSGRTGTQLYLNTGAAGGDRYGFSVSGVGDVNSDGFDDFAVGSPGAGNDEGHVHIYSGKNNDFSLLHNFTSSTAGEQFGFSVSGAGDVNNDGFADIIIGSPYYEDNGTAVGRARVYSGKDGTLLVSIVEGINSANEFGFSVSGVGDVNDDGFDDFIVGAPESDPNGTDSGRAYLMTLATGSLTTLDTISGTTTGERLGHSVRGVGDLNKDGHADFIIGSPSGDGSTIGSGKAQVFSGIDGTVLLNLAAATSQNNFGTSVGGAGDVNGDGTLDLVVGAPYALHPIFQWPTGSVSIFSGTDGSLIQELQGSHFLGKFGWSVSGLQDHLRSSQDINRDGLDDLIIGAPHERFDNGIIENGHAWVMTARIVNSTLNHIEGSGPSVIAPNVSISDPDDLRASQLVVQISGGYVPGEDVLSFTGNLPVGISSTGFDATTGTITFTGIEFFTRFEQNYQRLISQITYQNSSNNPHRHARTVSFTIFDRNEIGDPSGSKSSTATRIINITPVNDPPMIPLDQTFEVDENESAGTLIGNVVATDNETPDRLIYMIVPGDDSDWFAIDESGQLRVSPLADFDFETQTSYTLEIEVIDDGGESTTAFITININDLNEAPVFVNTPLFVPENSQAGSGVGSVFAQDPDAGQTLIYTMLTNADSRFFNMDATTGLITVAEGANLDYETRETYTLEVLAADNGSPQIATYAQITINVVDQNEVPLIEGGSFTIDTHFESGDIVGEIYAEDLDEQDTVSLSIQSGDPLGAFAIDNNGVITVADASKLGDLPSPISLSILATDPHSFTASATVVITINRGTFPTLFGWNPTTGDWQVSHLDGGTLSTSTGGNLDNNATYDQFLKGDFDGDGSTDVAARDADGNWYVGTTGEGGGFTFSQWGKWNMSASWQNVMVGDVNGDGHDDIMGRTGEGTWWVATGQDNRFENENWGRWSKTQTWKNVVTGDFNGDGQADVAGRANSGRWWVGLSDGTRFVNSRWGIWSAAATWGHTQVGDFTGDGIDDIAGATLPAFNWWVAVSNGTDQFTNQSFGSWDSSVNWEFIQAGDVTGDGIVDLVARYRKADFNDGRWFISRSTGNSFVHTNTGTAWTTATTWSNVMLLDIDDDGDKDIVGKTAGNSWWAARANGTTLTNTALVGWNGSVNWQGIGSGFLV